VDEEPELRAALAVLFSLLAEHIIAPDPDGLIHDQARRRARLIEVLSDIAEALQRSLNPTQEG